MCSAEARADPKSAREPIVRAALHVFGEAGIESTSLREVARAAGVSPALVVHHFGGKEGLVAAVDEAALREFGAAYRSGGDRDGAAGEVDLLRERAAQTARVMSEMPDVCRYLGRALVEGTAGSASLFRTMIGAGRGGKRSTRWPRRARCARTPTAGGRPFSTSS